MLNQFKKYTSGPPQLTPTFTNTDVTQVLQLGYSKPVATFALEACNGDVPKACEMLVEYGLVSVVTLLL